jgi:LuxR family maltose regulon positive regulatory protein
MDRWSAGAVLGMKTTYPSMVPRPRRGGVPVSKLEVPVASTRVLSRPRLLGLLPATRPRDGDPEGSRVTLVCGPAGCGKTTLLTEWARIARAGRAVAWVSLTSDDNDVFVLWSAILRALEGSGAWPGDSALHRLPAPRREVDGEFLAAFAAAFEQLRAPGVVLVLDDVNAVIGREAVATLEALLRECPPMLSVVLSTRFVQLLSVARLRLEGRVREVDGSCLEFSAAEAADLLDLHGVRLTEPELRQLLVRTEGWAAGLRLAAMWLARAPERSAMIADFARDDRAVADYLVGEVIERQEPHVRQFLLATAVCEELTPALARALSGRDDAGALLDHLERTHALITRLGGGSYRYHPMLREYLHAQLARQRPTAARELHHRAAVWFEQHGRTLPAIEHAADAEDQELLTRLLAGYGLSHITNGEGAGLRRVLGRIPTGWPINANPVVTLTQVAAALDAQDTRAVACLPVRLPVDATTSRDTGLGAGAVLDAGLDATAGLDAGPDGPERDGSGGGPGGSDRDDRDGRGGSRAAVPVPARAACHPLFLTAALQRARLRSDTAVATALLAQGTVRTGEADVDLLTALERGITWLWLGLPDRAGEELRRALSLAAGGRRDWMSVRCLSMLAGAALAGGDFDIAAARAAQALAFAGTRSWSQREVCGTARLTQGWLAYHRVDERGTADLARVAPCDPDAADLGPQLEPQLLAAVLRSAGPGTAHAAVGEIRQIWSTRWPGHVQPQLAAVALIIEQRLAYQAGATAWGVEVADRCRELLGHTGELEVVRAVNHAHRGRTRSARQLLAPVLSGQTRSMSVLTVIEAWLWEARLSDRAGQRQRADAAFAQAIALAAPRGALRPLLTGGREVAELLSRSSGTFGHSEAFAARARAALRADAAPSSSLLTTRELELLTELPSMRTAEEIATSLYVSVNTVKTHMRGIYRKLGVSNRRQAVVLARRRGLI